MPERMRSRVPARAGGRPAAERAASGVASASATVDAVEGEVIRGTLKLEPVVHYQRGMVGEAGVPGRRPVNNCLHRRGGEDGRGEVIVNAPAGVVVEGLSPLRPPSVGAVAVTRQAPVNILPADLLTEEAVKIGPLLRQEAGPFDVALPVPDVQLGVADVEVTHHEAVIAVLGELGEPLDHDVQE